MQSSFGEGVGSSEENLGDLLLGAGMCDPTDTSPPLGVGCWKERNSTAWYAIPTTNMKLAIGLRAIKLGNALCQPFLPTAGQGSTTQQKPKNKTSDLTSPTPPSHLESRVSLVTVVSLSSNSLSAMQRKRSYPHTVLHVGAVACFSSDRIFVTYQ